MKWLKKLKEFMNIASLCDFRLKRALVIAGGICLCIGFVKETATNTLEWRDYVAFAFALTMLAVPHTAVQLVREWRAAKNGISGDIESDTDKPLQAIKIPPRAEENKGDA